MLITHSYLGTTLNGARCHFFLLFEDYIDAQHGISSELRMEIERFARNMGNFGAVVAPFAGDVPDVRVSISDKKWSDDELRLIRNTPGMLMIDKDFDDFDPRTHSWVVFHFGRGTSQFPSANSVVVQDAAKFRSVLQKITDAMSVESSDPFEVVRSALRNSVISSASQSFHLRPNLFGVGIDLRAAWSPLKDYLRNRKSRG